MVRRNHPAEKISKTALLAGAALAFPVVSKASVVYVNNGSMPLFTVTSAQGSSSSTQDLTIDLGPSDTVTPFSFTAGGGVTGPDNFAEDTIGTPGIGDWVGSSSSSGSVMPFSTTGTEIGPVLDPSLAYYNGTGVLQKIDGDPTMTTAKGPWPTDGSSAYLGIEFEDANNSSLMYYGWVQLSACVPDQTPGNPCGDPSGMVGVISYAYQSTANTGIAIGQTSDVPEPSSIALFALGAAGLVAYRRRKLAA